MKKLYLLLLCATLAVSAHAQSKKKKSPAAINKQNKESEKFLEKQWWLGIKGGTNLSKLTVETSYSVIQPTNYDHSTISKKYQSFKQLGSQITFEATFYFKGFSFSFQPTFQHAVFSYTNSFSWDNEVEPGTNRLELNYEQEQKVDHLILPLIVKYELIGNKIRPYLQAGIYTGVLLNATKSVTVSGVDYASGGTNNFENDPIIVGAKDLFAKNHWGLLGGAGVYYNLGNVRLNLDIVYKNGFSNIASTENRYSSDRLSGIGDVLDDATLDNLSFSIGCLFPLRFLERGFKSLDRKK